MTSLCLKIQYMNVTEESNFSVFTKTLHRQPLKDKVHGLESSQFSTEVTFWRCNS